MKDTPHSAIVKRSSKVLISFLTVFTIVFSLLQPIMMVQASTPLKDAPLTRNSIEPKSGKDGQVNLTVANPGSHPNSTSTLTTSFPSLTGPASSNSPNSIDCHPGINLSKQVSTSLAGPWTSFIMVPPETSVYYRLTVENTGDVDLTNVSVSDPDVDLSGCALSTPFTLTTANPIASCTTGAATIHAGDYLNTATVQGKYSWQSFTSSSSAEVLAINPVPAPGLTLEKLAGSSAQGPWSSMLNGVAPGSNIYYRFSVVNSGNISLSGLSINDAQVDTSACWLTDPLAPGAATTCVVGPVTAITGIHTNVATAQSTTPAVTSSPSDATYTSGCFTITGVVWQDLNADGVIDSGEPRLSNVTLTLYLDNGDGIFNPAEDTLLETQSTAVDGSYSFDTLPPGTYFVRVTAGVEGMFRSAAGAIRA